MIAIISDHADVSTNHVIDWLIFYGHPFIRINPKDAIFRIIYYCPDNNDINLSIEFENREYDYASIGSIWYRRGEIDFGLIQIGSDDIHDVDIRNEIKDYLVGEGEIVASTLLESLKAKKSLNSLLDVFVNKLHVLQTAKNVGLKIPDTILTSSTKIMREFKRKHNRIICKPSNTGPMNPIGGLHCAGYTCEVFDNDLIADDDTLGRPPSMLQELIEKICDIRIFYMKGKIYSSAVFSQSNKQTQIDFRRYDDKRPNRIERIELPSDVSERIDQLMRLLDMESGSIDIVLSSKGEYVFLEVNPIGQFGQVSAPCNYYIEREIALALIEDDARQA